MKTIAVASALMLAGYAHAETQVFKAWLAGCDNTMACTAIGMQEEDGGDYAYVRITRAAGASAAPEARVVVLVQDGEEGPAELSITIDGKPFGGALKGSHDGTWARADIAPADIPAFTAAIANASEMTVQRTDEAGQPVVRLPLPGSSAALRWIDAQQKRDGGVTAIVAKGDKPAAVVPPSPGTPYVTARRMRQIDGTPKPPAALPKAEQDMCARMEETTFAYDLGDGATLWGVCAGTGAYNFSYDMYVAAKDGTITPVAPLPGDEEGASVLMLTNPFLTEDGKIISAFAKGRGLGDCGDWQDWVWDGTTFQLAGRSVMDKCRAVSPEEWITVYRATVR